MRQPRAPMRQRACRAARARPAVARRAPRPFLPPGVPVALRPACDCGGRRRASRRPAHARRFAVLTRGSSPTKTRIYRSQTLVRRPTECSVSPAPWIARKRTQGWQQLLDTRFRDRPLRTARRSRRPGAELLKRQRVSLGRGKNLDIDACGPWEARLRPRQLAELLHRRRRRHGWASA